MTQTSSSLDISSVRDHTQLPDTDGTFVSGKTVKPGRFWVYERIIRIPYYGIYKII